MHLQFIQKFVINLLINCYKLDDKELETEDRAKCCGCGSLLLQ
ncbi:hypothetical protein CHK_2409 [Christensenella hongkongensis]|uniref:Uncharacterized protein n=1 Tax=Christensenella hongkongensis TaxID=270498 RepID=A0A0M2NHB0_9FIRM|nr:hypothetical protein CHK_2409 [Christensenella hongkongensis]